MDYVHQPVMVQEVVDSLLRSPDGIYLDGTVGTGGHSEVISKRLSGKGRLVCLDRDPDAVRLSKKRLAFMGNHVCVTKASYSDFDRILAEIGFNSLDGAFLDLGMSSHQLENSGRGFSFNRKEPLDMRMDPEEELTACQLVNHSSQSQLRRILKENGEEKRAGKIAKVIVRERKKNFIETSDQLAFLVKTVFPPSFRKKNRHPATRTFQALRIAVNGELNKLNQFLEKIPYLLAAGGRLVILSYHSLEDRSVKRTMRYWENPCTCPPDLPQCVCGNAPLFKRIFKKGLKPKKREIETNPRSRSAVLRVSERL